MSTFDLKKLAISAIGTIALSATCVLAAVAPVRAAAAPLTLRDWQQSVSNKVSSSTDMATNAVAPGTVTETILALRFTAEGDFAGVSITRSSGNLAIDRHAIVIADGTSYPPLPAELRGKPQTISLRLAVGDEQALARHLARDERATAADRAIRIAAR